ncbi:MAG: carbohydrate ABC transporter substrate-binding protein [Vallitalea sp.]|jgi:N-acetylglucosamine transport system substrate-binding protein|nr:carbohydrate ABC transporter substrate-binding protein [Vallitalea sp.]
MKKLLTLLISVCLITSLAACSSNTKPTTSENEKQEKQKPQKQQKAQKPQEKVLKIAGLNGGYGVEHWKELASKFEAANPGVKIELTLEKNIAEILRPQIQARNIPDIIYLAVGSEGKLTDTLIKEKAIQDITDVLDMEVPNEGIKVKDKIVPGFTDTLITNPYGDGKTYLVPLFYSPCGLFYNKDLFEEGKYKFPETWDELLALGETAKSDGISLFTYPTTGYFDAFFYALLNEVGGANLFNEAMNYEEEAWTSKEATKAFELIGELAKYTHPDTVSQANKEGFTKNQQLILDNKALFIPNGTWLPGEMKDAPRADGFKWGFTALPKVKADQDAYSYTFFEQMYIPEGAKEVDLAKKFMAYMYSDEAAKIIFEKGHAVQPIIGVSKFMQDEDQNKLFYSVYDNGAKAAMGGFAAAPPVEGVDLTSSEGILFGTVNSIVTKNKTVEQWQKEVIEAAVKIRKAMKSE